LIDAFSGNTHPTFEGQQIVATSFEMAQGDGPLSWTILALQVEGDGSLAATFFDPRNSAWNFGKPVTFVGGPQNPNFTLIAVNHHRKLYGVVNQAILEYRIDNSNLARLIYITDLPLNATTSR
jgi:hypothetical protein